MKKNFLKIFILLLMIVVVSATAMASSTDFLSTWNTEYLTSGSSSYNQIILPLEPTGTYNFLIDWGDGSSDTITTWNQSEVTHTYASSGTYDLNMSGIFYGWEFKNTGDRNKIVDVSQWGNLIVSNNGGVFYGCNNLDASATDVLDVSMITNFADFFRDAYVFNGVVSDWEIDNVISFANMFSNARQFNQPLNMWVVDNSNSFNAMFYGAWSFNQDLDQWDVTNAAPTTFSSMFRNAYAFNGNISTWDVSGITNPDFMFWGAHSFNQPLNDWDTSNFVGVFYMFRDCYVFNQPLDNWDVSGITNFHSMFYNAKNFNQNINSWNISSVTNLYSMFRGANNFNQPLDNWDVSGVTNLGYMFYQAYDFDQNIGSWNISSVTNLAQMFSYVNMSISNYDSLLNGWAGLATVPSGLTFDGGYSNYCQGESSRDDVLITTKGWTITDGGKNCVVASSSNSRGTALSIKATVPEEDNKLKFFFLIITAVVLWLVFNADKQVIKKRYN